MHGNNTNEYAVSMELGVPRSWLGAIIKSQFK